jgi:hypothetical protein
MKYQLDPNLYDYYYYFLGISASLYFLRWLWLKLYPPNIPDQFRNNASIEKAEQAIKKVEEFFESIARGNEVVSLTLAEEELNAICKIKKSIYHFSINENTLFAYELKDFYVLSIKGYTFTAWKISFDLYYDNYFKRDIVIEVSTLTSLKGGMFYIPKHNNNGDNDYPKDERLFLSRGKLVKVLSSNVVNRESRERGIPINYIKQIEIKDGNLIFFA